MAAGAIAGKFDDGAPNTNGMIAGAPAAGGVKVEGAAAKVKAGTVAVAEETLLAAADTAAPNTNGALVDGVDGANCKVGVTKGMRLGRPNALAAAEIPPDAGSPSAGVEAGVAAVAVEGVQVTVPIADDGAPKLNTGALMVLLAAGLVSDMAAAGKAPKDSTGS